MFRLFEGRTADEVWLQAAAALDDANTIQLQPGRGGPTREILHAAFTIADPRQRWVLSRSPGLNPAFAIAEIVWIISGRRDSAFLNYWNSQLPKYAGDGPEYHGAYGYRLRRHFGVDQLERACQALQSDPAGRQVVLQIWDPVLDMPQEDGSPRNPDVPCNLCTMLKIRDGRLEWTQVMRSNDLFLGAPYNFLQFTTLQEVLAGWLGVIPGAYHHLSDSLHVYHEAMTLFGADRSVQPAENADSLLLPRAESEGAFGILESAIVEMIRPDLLPHRLERIVLEPGLPVAFCNLLRVVGAEAARRRNWPPVEQALMAKCTNPLLRQVWKQWLSRFGLGCRARKAETANPFD